MRYRDGRRSVCVSSQSGCPLTCTFCATGAMRFGRNLTASEILDQVLHFRRIEPVDHLVFMGMGEPLMNLDNVLAAAERLPDAGITHRRTGISTVGWVPGIRRLTEECDMPLRLALSLHAPEDALRSRIMPVNERFDIAEVLAACEDWYAKRRRRVFVEYLMLGGVNDTVAQARQLAALLDRRVYKVNLIPYNPTGGRLRGLLARGHRRLQGRPGGARLRGDRPPHPRPRHRRRLRPARRQGRRPPRGAPRRPGDRVRRRAPATRRTPPRDVVGPSSSARLAGLLVLLHGDVDPMNRFGAAPCQWLSPGSKKTSTRQDG